MEPTANSPTRQLVMMAIIRFEFWMVLAIALKLIAKMLLACGCERSAMAVLAYSIWLFARATMALQWAADKKL